MEALLVSIGVLVSFLLLMVTLIHVSWSHSKSRERSFEDVQQTLRELSTTIHRVQEILDEGFPLVRLHIEGNEPPTRSDCAKREAKTTG